LLLSVFDPVTLTLSPLAAPNNALLQWYSVVGETYFVQYTPDLGNPTWTTIGIVVATTTCSTFAIPPGYLTSSSGYFRLSHTAAVPLPAPTLTVQFSTAGPCGPSDPLRLSWSTDYPGYTLQSAPSPFGPWSDIPMSQITIVGNNFVFCDNVSGPAKYYRLFQ
jgi:hypothetical protein